MFRSAKRAGVLLQGKTGHRDDVLGDVIPMAGGRFRPGAVSPELRDLGLVAVRDDPTAAPSAFTSL